MGKPGDRKLKDWEDEEVADVVFQLEKSFGIKFSKTAFINLTTFGELCDIIESYVAQYDNRDDCTKQQAFYKLRKTIATTQLIDEKKIGPGSKLADIFPKHNRRSQVKKLKNQLGINMEILEFPDWLVSVFVVGFILSVISFFFDWQIAVSGIVFIILASNIPTPFRKKLALTTMRQLTEVITREHYAKVRRSKQSVNRREIPEIVKDTFSEYLEIDKAYLTKDAKFIWSE